MRYQYAQALAEQISSIQAALPSIQSRDDLDVTTRAVPEFNVYTGEWFMSWLIDEESKRLYLYYPHIGDWQVKYDVTAQSLLANGVHLGRDAEPANTIPLRTGFGPLTDVISQANHQPVTH